jgi:hypothetical protein
LLLQYLGGSTVGERGEKLFEELCQLWPPGSVTVESLRKVAALPSAVCPSNQFPSHPRLRR